MHSHPSRVWALLFALAQAFIGFGALVESIQTLSGHPPATWRFTLLPMLTLEWGWDPLSGWFILVASSVSILAACYGVGYSRSYRSGSQALLIHVAQTVFVASLIAVPLARTIFAFVFAWEIMSVSSYVLVICDPEDPQSRRSGLIYIVMTQVGTAFLVLGVLVSGSGLDFHDVQASFRAASPALRSVIFGCLFVGLATKGGLVPFHVWLPHAHPQAPSPTSALMSGVMIKMAAYGLLRFGVLMLGPGPREWGIAVMGLGVISAFRGALNASIEKDVKRMLAHSSIENSGIIWIGLGLAMIFFSIPGQQAAGALALAAALLHVLNHALFKSLLFFGSGAVAHAAHTRRLDALGGLLRRMPVTSTTFLIGALAASAIPPLNGFLGEWLLLQSLLGRPEIKLPLISIAGLFSAAVLALSAGLSAACFVRAFGATFLALPRSEPAASAKEEPWSMLTPMIILSFLCVATGLFPVTVLGTLAPIVQQFEGTNLAVPESGWLLQTRNASYGPLILLTALAAIAAGAWASTMIRARIRRSKTWTCGVEPSPGLEYTATGFAQPIRGFFRPLLRSREGIRTLESGPTYELAMESWAEDFLYRPLQRLSFRIAHAASFLQAGSLHLYLAYSLITILFFLLLAL